MPHYVESTTGLKVDAATATSNGRIRPGFRKAVADGTYIGFDITMMDSEPGAGRMYLTDSDPNGWSKAVRDMVRDGRHHMSDRCMTVAHGDAPAQPITAGAHGGSVADSAAVRDAVRNARYS